jgi:hypothetical protein
MFTDNLLAFKVGLVQNHTFNYVEPMDIEALLSLYLTWELTS